MNKTIATSGSNAMSTHTNFAHQSINQIVSSSFALFSFPQTATP